MQSTVQNPVKGVKKEHPCLHIICCLLTAALATLSVIHPAFAIAGFLSAAIYVMLSKPQEIFLLLFFLAPFANVFKISLASSSLFVYLELLSLLKLAIVQKKWKMHFIILFLVFVGFLAIGSAGNFTVLIKQAAIPLLIYFFFSGAPKTKSLVLHYSGGLMLSSAIALFAEYIPNMSKFISSERAYELEEDVVRFTGLYSDPNYYSLALILALVTLLLLYSRKSVSGWIAFPVFALSSVFGALTVSKSFLLMLVIVFVIFFFDLLRNKKFKTAFIFFAIVAVLLVHFLNSGTSIFQNTIDRFLASEGMDLTTNRSSIWQDYFSFFDENTPKLFLGSGIGAGYHLGHAPHNTYIDFLYYYGVFGTILFFALLVSMCKKITLPRIANLLPLVCVAVMISFLSALQHYDFVFALIIVLHFLSIDLKNTAAVPRSE